MKNWQGIYYVIGCGNYFLSSEAALLGCGKGLIFHNQQPYNHTMTEGPSECFMLIPKAPGDWDCD